MTTIAAMRASAGRAHARWSDVLVYAGERGTILKLLDDLTEAEIAAKLPVQLRHLPETVAA